MSASEAIAHNPTAASATDLEKAAADDFSIGHGHVKNNSQRVLDCPPTPGIFSMVVHSLRSTFSFNKYHSKPGSKHLLTVLQSIFPILSWARFYKLSMLKKDVMAGLTLASLCIPQSIGYATLANLEPQYGLYTSVVPPLIYAVMGTSREIAIGPVAVVSLLLSSMIQKLEDPVANPIGFRNIALTATLFAGVFQAAFGIFRLGFLVDFLSHAAIVGFMAGAAIVIGLQQLKGLLGISHFTNKTDIISVVRAIWTSVHHSSFFLLTILQWNPYNFILGSAFLCFILITRFVGRRNKKLFWIGAVSPLISVGLATVIVFVTKADEHGVKIIKHIKGGLNPSSVHQLQLNDPNIGEIAKIGLVVAVIALTEAIAVGRSFSTMKGYSIDGNKEMVAMGFMNILGSLSSCYVATGSFSRSAVNFSAGCETAVSNIVMAVTVILCLELFTRMLYYTPMAILASIILSALPGLIDFHEAVKIWKIDKLDFLTCLGAFLGVLFASVEIGLLVAVGISFVKIILISIQPGTEILGRIPETDVYCDINQYPMAIQTPPVLTIRLKSGLLCFANANFVKEKVLRWATKDDEHTSKLNGTRTIQLVVLDLSNLMNIDVSGIASLEELHKNLISKGVELAISNPRWEVIEKLKLAKFVSKIGGKVFLTVGEAIDACLGAKVIASI
ncbi:Sulfate transporter 2.1 [Linum perenne]